MYVSLSSHVSLHNSSMGICKAGLLLHAFLHTSRDIHLLHWWSDDCSSEEGDEPDNVASKSENSSCATVVEHKSQVREGLQCKTNTFLVLWSAYGVNSYVEGGPTAKSHFKAKDVSRVRTQQRVSWWQTGSKAQEPFFQGAPTASVGGAQICRSHQHHRESLEKPFL